MPYKTNLRQVKFKVNMVCVSRESEPAIRADREGGEKRTNISREGRRITRPLCAWLRRLTSLLQVNLNDRNFWNIETMCCKVLHSENLLEDWISCDQAASLEERSFL